MTLTRQHVITPGSLVNTLEYLNKSKEEKEKICLDLVEKAFKRMKVNAPLELKMENMLIVLDRSLKYLENREEYEQAQIILDLKNTVPEVFDKLRSDH